MAQPSPGEMYAGEASRMILIEQDGAGNQALWAVKMKTALQQVLLPSKCTFWNLIAEQNKKNNGVTNLFKIANEFAWVKIFSFLHFNQDYF